MKRKIGVITSTRAEFGILRWLLEELRAQRDVELQLFVTGSHLHPEHGQTVNEIRSAGFVPTAELPILPTDLRSPTMMETATAGAITQIAQALRTHGTELAVVLGDRYEILGAAIGASFAQVPLAHLHGGEITEGAIDDSFRHAITKLSQLHFTSTPEYSNRVIQLGESPDRVFHVGALGIDALHRLPLLTRSELAEKLAFPRIASPAPLVLATLHPETLSTTTPEAQAKDFLNALDVQTDATIVITGSNADPGGEAMNDAWRGYAARHVDRVLFVSSLGSLKYWSMLKACDLVIGNSSSGILEAPSAGKPVVDIGNRQKGRLHGSSVLHCAPDTVSIAKAIHQASRSEFRQRAAEKIDSPYHGQGNVAAAIARQLRAVSLSELRRKSFYDLPR